MVYLEVIYLKTNKELINNYIIEKYYSDKKSEGITTQEVSEKFNMQRSNVSAILNKLVLEGSLSKTSTRPVRYMPKNDSIVTKKDALQSLQGANGSLKNQIELAKAALLYPSQNVNVLISSKPGSGASIFCKKMYEYAIEKNVITADAPFIKVRVRSFENNLATLSKVLFGDEHEMSSFEKGINGFLVIDHFDMLDAEQQAKVFDIIENMTLEEKDKSIILLTCSEKYRDSFSRNFPFIIELPAWENISLEERYGFVSEFFKKESMNSKKNITVTSETIKALMLSNYTRGLKELKFLIKSACAKGYLRSIEFNENNISIDSSDFDKDIKQSLFKEKQYNALLSKLFNSPYITIGVTNDYPQKDSTWYEKIQKQYLELTNRGMDKANASTIISDYMKSIYEKVDYSEKNRKIDMEQLSKLVDGELILIVENWLNHCSQELKRVFETSIFTGLCLHINSLVDPKHIPHPIDNNRVVSLIQNHPKEYHLVGELVYLLERKYQLKLSTEDEVLIMLFIISEEDKLVNGRPVLLYAMHGENVATALAKVTNTFTNTDNIYSYDMHLEYPTEKVYSDLEELLTNIDEGKGVIVIYDMGSLKTIIETISNKIGITTRLINMPITMIGIDVARRSSMEEDLDKVYHQVMLEMNRESMQYKTNIIVTLCHTGEGGAAQLKYYIEEHSKLGMNVFPMEQSNREELIKSVSLLRKRYNIHAFVGTFNPQLFGIPFIPIDKIFTVESDKLDKILMFEPSDLSDTNYSAIYENFEESFEYADIPKIKSVLPDIINTLATIYNLSKSQELGLFTHMAALIERTLSGETNHHENKMKERILKYYKEDYKEITKRIKPVEKTFNIIIDDDEIANIIMIIRKL